MNVIETIKRQLPKATPGPIAEFGSHNLFETIDGGEQGVVIRAKNRLGMNFAIKYHLIGTTDRRAIQSDIADFKREMSILAKLNHKNIVKIFTGGIAKWSAARNRWTIHEGIPERFPVDAANTVLYYIMNYIEGSDLNKIYPELCPAGKKIEPVYRDKNIRLRLFEKMITEVSSAMYHYQTLDGGVAHRDIKPQNIRYSTIDDSFIIVDFGFARHATSPQVESTIRRPDIFDVPSFEKGDYMKNDMGQFSLMLRKIMPGFNGEYDDLRYDGLARVIARGHHQTLEQRYKTMKDFHEDARKYFVCHHHWKFQLRMYEYMAPNRFGLFNAKLREPISGSMLLNQPVKRIIDTPEFQRLKGIRQLGPTFFVFPGACHTRFEHSLGAYNLSLKYLEKLVDLPSFNDICGSNEAAIKLFALSALLHDIGHYPYSHWIEEIKTFPHGITFPSHEERASAVIEGGRIKGILTDIWGISIPDLSKIIATRRCEDEPKKGHELINSIINSCIDVDRIDYLMRDSVHCGVEYGLGIDLERLFDALYIDEDIKSVCLTTKGLSSLLSVLNCRNIMYQEVYWHKTVRACEAMFKRFFYEYILHNIETKRTIESYFKLTDDQFTSKLFEMASKERRRNSSMISRLMAPFTFQNRGRDIFKPGYIYSPASADTEPGVESFFQKIVDAPYQQIVAYSNRLAAELKRLKGFSAIHDLDIIIERTPVRPGYETTKISQFRFWDERRGGWERHDDILLQLNNYLFAKRKAYIFISTDYYSKFKKLAKKPSIAGTSQLNRILNNILD